MIIDLLDNYVGSGKTIKNTSKDNKIKSNLVDYPDNPDNPVNYPDNTDDFDKILNWSDNEIIEIFKIVFADEKIVG